MDFGQNSIFGSITFKTSEACSINNVKQKMLRYEDLFARVLPGISHQNIEEEFFY